MNKLSYDVRHWIGDGRTIRGKPSGDNGGVGLAQAILESFRAAYPAQSEDMELLQVTALVCGYADVNKMLGTAICESDGSRTLTLRPV